MDLYIEPRQVYPQLTVMDIAYLEIFHGINRRLYVKTGKKARPARPEMMHDTGLLNRPGRLRMKILARVFTISAFKPRLTRGTDLKKNLDWQVLTFVNSNYLLQFCTH